MENTERVAEKIIIKYDNGDTKEVEKGVVITFTEDEKIGTTELELANMNWRDLTIAALSIVQLADKMGVIEDVTEEE